MSASEPSDGYTPCCWRAGELIRERCEDPRVRRVRATVSRKLGSTSSISVPGGHLAVSGESVEDWLDCGQCPDCFLPAFRYRPGKSAQYALALSNFDGVAHGETPLRFRFGFIGSSDNHTARPGTGYKEYERIKMTEAKGPRDAAVDRASCTCAARSRCRSRCRAPTVKIVAFPETTFFSQGARRLLLHDGRAGSGARGRTRSRLAVGGARAARGLRNQRPAHPALVRPAQRPRRHAVRPDGLGGGALRRSPEVLACVPRARSCSSPAARTTPAHALELRAPGVPVPRASATTRVTSRQRIERIEIVRIRPQILPRRARWATLIDDPWLQLRLPAGRRRAASVEFDDPDFTGRRAARCHLLRARPCRSPRPRSMAPACAARRDSRTGSCIEPRSVLLRPAHAARRRLPRPRRGAGVGVADLRHADG